MVRAFVFAWFLFPGLLAVAFAAPPTITVPKEVTGNTGDFIPIVVETEGKQVKFVAITPGLKVFPPDFLVNPKSTVVSAAAEGDYTLLCYTGKGDEVSNPVYINVKIGAGGGVEPEPMGGAITKDPLYKLVKEHWKTVPAAEKAKKPALSAVYKATADSVSGIDTAGALFNVLKSATDARVGANVLKPLREAFGTELASFLPTTPSQVLTAEEKTETAKQLRRFSAILDSIK